MNTPGMAKGVSLAICFAVWTAPAAIAQQKQSSASSDSNCPPAWMRQTTTSGAQIGSGQPDGSLPIGCYKSSFELAPPIGYFRPKEHKRHSTD